MTHHPLMPDLLTTDLILRLEIDHEVFRDKFNGKLYWLDERDLDPIFRSITAVLQNNVMSK
jgi:hypothetical protein